MPPLVLRFPQRVSIHQSQGLALRCSLKAPVLDAFVCRGRHRLSNSNLEGRRKPIIFSIHHNFKACSNSRQAKKGGKTCVTEAGRCGAVIFIVLIINLFISHFVTQRVCRGELGRLLPGPPDVLADRRLAVGARGAWVGTAPCTATDCAGS